ncbi:MAG: OmpH family outer membrane protein [Paracoccaceae bacterium]
MRAAIAAALLAAVLAPAAPAQQLGPVRAAPEALSVAVIDLEALFARTLLGQRLRAEIVQATEELAAENRRIEARLTAEVQDLTERRATMEPEAFRAEAAEFEARVEAIRRAQDDKERALEGAASRARDLFGRTMRPVLTGLMAENGIGLLLDSRDVVIAATVVDLTDRAVAGIDAALGDGTGDGTGSGDATGAGEDTGTGPGDGSAPGAGDGPAATPDPSDPAPAPAD